ncbi:MAG: thioredoxin domain-containing protein, partial [Pyrinomonadaceae bacterium]
GHAPKFPSSMTLEFLLRYFARTGARSDKSEALKAVELTCRKMAEGGIYDQLGGGFHRYSTDARWLVPHFEKMLYDNALLSKLYLHLYQATNDDFFRRIAEETFDYVAREMMAPNGSFYSTQDADSEGVEGKFFVWSLNEIEAVLGKEDARVFASYFGVTAEGNFEGENILNISRTKNEIAADCGLSESELEEVISRSRQRLFDLREKRIKPGRDEKILTDWNGLMLGSFAEAAAVFNRPDYLEIAKKNAAFILGQMRREEFLFHTNRDGSPAKLKGYLDDYAFVAEGLLSLFEATGEWQWLRETEWFVERMIQEFWDDEDGGFFFTGRSHESLIIRNKDFVDNATPSGNSSAVSVLLRLSMLFGNQSYSRMANSILCLLRTQMMRYPSGFGHALCALDFHLAEVKEIVVISPANQIAPQDDLLREVWRRYLPNKIVIQTTKDAQVPDKILPFVEGRKAIDGKATAYVCVNNTCQQPVTTIKELRLNLDRK